MHKRLLKAGLVGTTALLFAGSSIADGDNGNGEHGKSEFEVSARLIGYQEVPALSTIANGKFTATINTDAGTITWRLRYDALEGTVTQSHVHFGQMGVNGGISFFLCSNLANPPPNTQACPAPPADISGVITAAEVIGPGGVAPNPVGQGIEPGAIGEIMAAIRAGIAYANVHRSKWPAGEIRGQL